MNLTFEPAPPPLDAPVQPEAERLFLPHGLDVAASRSQWRCNECDKMQSAGSAQVWVVNGTQKRDPVYAVTERARKSAFNGEWSAWCLSCTAHWQKEMRKIAGDVDNAITPSLWDRMRRIFTARGE